MITEKTIHISKVIIDDMIDHLRSELPNEGCGYLSGKNEEEIINNINFRRSNFSD